MKGPGTGVCLVYATYWTYCNLLYQNNRFLAKQAPIERLLPDVPGISGHVAIYDTCCNLDPLGNFGESDLKVTRLLHCIKSDKIKLGAQGRHHFLDSLQLDWLGIFQKVVVYLHWLASWQSHCADKNSRSVDATDCDIRRINGLGEISYK